MDYCILPGCATLDKDGIWFVDREYTLLFFWDKNSKVITRAKKIPGVKYKVEGAFLDIKCIGKKVILAPNISNEIVVYDEEKDTFERIFIDRPCCENFRKIHEIDKGILIVPNYYERIIRLDMCEMNLFYGDRWNKMDAERHIQSSCISGKYVYAAINNELIMKYDVEMDKWKVEYTFEGMKISAVFVKEENLYFFDVNATELILFDMKDRKIVNRYKIGTKSIKLYVFFDKYVWLDEVYGSSYWIFDINLILKKRGMKIEGDITKSNASCFANCAEDAVIYEITSNGVIYVYDEFLSQTIIEMKLSPVVEKIIEDTSFDYINNKLKFARENQIIDETRLVGISDLLSAMCCEIV